MPLPFLAPGDLERSGLPDDGIEIANPLVAEESVLRTSLLPRPRQGARHQRAAPQHRRRTVGDRPRVPPAGPGDEAGELPDEREMLGVALGGRDAREAVHEWRAIADVLAVQAIELRNEPVPGLHPTRGRTGGAGRRGGRRGRRGRPGRARGARHRRARRLGRGRPRRGVRPPARPAHLPARERVPVERHRPGLRGRRGGAGERLEGALRAAAGDRLASLRLFDVYRGAGIAPDRRSLAYSLRLDAPDHTLTDDEVAEVRRRCIEAVEGAFPAMLRG